MNKKKLILLALLIGTIIFMSVILYRNHLVYQNDYFGVQITKLIRENKWYGYAPKDVEWHIIKPFHWSPVRSWKAKITFPDEPDLQYYFQFRKERVYLLEVIGDAEPQKIFPTMDEYRAKIKEHLWPKMQKTGSNGD